jgi:D-arabinose 1-dehydrogenase-like Zn-dependent alcohol dehydrogenase
MDDFFSYDVVNWGKPFKRNQQVKKDPVGNEVLIKITASGLCHSDIHIRKGFFDLGEKGIHTLEQRGAKLPVTIGHEIAGEVIEIGSTVKNLSIGQSVIVFPWIGCGGCLACDEDRESDCTNMNIIGINQNGGFASHVLVQDEKFVFDITGLDPAKVAPYACSGLTVYNALTKLGELRDGEWLAVLGTGGLGLNAISIAKALGYKNIIAIDIDDTKLAAAVEMGADQTLNSKSKTASNDLIALCEGRLFGVIDTFGSQETANLAVSTLTKTGRYVTVGLYGGDFIMPQVWLPQKAMTVRGSHVGNSPQLKILIEMYRDGKLKDIPIEKRPLSEINNAMNDLENGRVTGRIILCP